MAISPGGHYPLESLSVTSNRDSSLATQRSVHSAIHERAVTCWDSVRSPGAMIEQLETLTDMRAVSALKRHLRV
jgi:hypothetical protein